MPPFDADENDELTLEDLLGLPKLAGEPIPSPITNDDHKAAEIVRNYMSCGHSFYDAVDLMEIYWPIPCSIKNVKKIIKQNYEDIKKL